MHRLRTEGVVKSLLFQPTKKKLPSFKTMATNPLQRSNRTPFIGVPYNVGSTTPWDRRDKSISQASFGRVRSFFRFNFTSAISELPFAIVKWCNYTVTGSSRHVWEGFLTEDTWNEEDPTDSIDDYPHNPFVQVEEFLPSRFVMTYDKNFDVSFVALDQERLGPLAGEGPTTDMGDDILHFSNGKASSFGTHLNHPNVTSYCDMDLSTLP